jgi:glutathione synthase/RimK-type ligase-like ATP-grasp enzyme
MPARPFTILCVAFYFKGVAFIRKAKSLGCRVYLLTNVKLADEPWPRESLDDIFYLHDEGDQWSRESLLKGVSYMARTLHFDRIVALDDFDVEKAALLREHLRVPGMGDTRTRYFRDKLAMRTQAAEAGIPVPAFVGLIHYDEVRQFLEQVPGPWVLKPRFSASATGIKKVLHADALWPILDQLGDQQSYHLLEQFVPGHVYHVDSIVYDRTVVFARAHQYTDTPMRVAHEGGIFATHTVAYGSPAEGALLEENRRVLAAMGLREGASHTEFIQAEADGRFYFLETSARVGGAHIAEMLEASSGLNQWEEWARIEALRPGEPYLLPPIRHDYSGIILSLAQQSMPDTSAYDDPEIVWRMQMHQHVGLIVRSPRLERVQELLARYTERFYDDFFAWHPITDRPAH